MPDEKSPLSRFSPEVRSAFERFLKDRDRGDLRVVVSAVLKEYMPKRPDGTPPASFDASQRIVEDLGYDSLAMGEIIFFFEDLLEVSIPNEEILGLATVGDLETYVASKLRTADPN